MARPNQIVATLTYTCFRSHVNFELKGVGVVTTQAPPPSVGANTAYSGMDVLNPPTLLPQCTGQFQPMQ